MKTGFRHCRQGAGEEAVPGLDPGDLTMCCWKGSAVIDEGEDPGIETQERKSWSWKGDAGGKWERLGQVG